MTDIRFPKASLTGVIAKPHARFRGPPKPDRRSWLVRPDDLLVFEVDRLNLRIAPGKNGKPATLHRDGPGDCFLIVRLPPQNLGEIAYFTVADEFPEDEFPVDWEDLPKGPETPDDPPIRAIIAGWTRLAFAVPDTALPIDWTSHGVLAAIAELELNVAPNALPRRTPQRLLHLGLVASLGPLTTASSAVLETALAAGLAGDRAFVDLEAAVGRALDSAAARATGTGRATTGSDRLTGIARASTIRNLARSRRNARLGAHALGISVGPGASFGDDLATQLIDPDRVVVPELFRPRPAPPGPNQTAIELPWRVVISPSKLGAWFHAPDPVTSEATGRTELWHTRLGTRVSGDIVPNDPQRTVRAIWALSPPGEMPITMPGKPTQTDLIQGLPPIVPTPPYLDDPFRTSMTEFDRHNVVHLSSNFQLKRLPPKKGNFEPSPLDVDHLALSALGGWLDSRGAWQEQPRGLAVEEWRHRAALGRDHYVRIVYAGRLCPVGHRASLVKITERRFEPKIAGNPAYLRQRMFIVVREPIRTYRQSGWTYKNPDDDDDPRNGERWDLKFPFQSIRITSLVSPLLDPPADSVLDPAQKANSIDLFWPYVGGRPFCFDVVAIDAEGKPVDLAMPLIFVGQTESDKLEGSDFPDLAVQSYRTRTWPGVGTLLATVPVGGQKLSFAEPDKPDDTTFAVQTLTFDIEVPEPAVFKNPALLREPRYLPVLRTVDLDVPALQKIAQTTSSAGLLYDRTYLHAGFETGNPGQVFLARDPAKSALAVAFSSRSERSGGLVAPDLSLSGLSRISGPVSGDIETAAADGKMVPSAWFADVFDDAKLFGVLNLAHIVEEVGFDKLDQLPRLAGGVFDQVQRLVADLERLDVLLKGMAAPQLAIAQSLLDQLTNPTTGSIAKLLTGGPPSDVWDQLGLLDNALDGLPAALDASSLTAGPRAVLTEAAASLRNAIAALGAAPELLDAFANGDFLPEDLTARFEWRPKLLAWPASTPVFIPKGDKRNLLLSVEASGEDLVVTCSLDDFDLDLRVLILEFERVQFRSRAGAKPEIDVNFTKFAFAGPLSFIETLREIIPLDGFSDPPEVSVTAEGITAGFSMGLPNIAFGVFSLENLSLAAGFTVPFVGPPMSTWFRFCERENPSRLTVMMFGGGFFFGVTVNAEGLQVAEGAIEFGAAISVNFGVASGSVSAMAGLYFKIESDEVTLAGYFRLRGEVDVLGLISVCIELYLEMRYETASGKCVGTATISIEVDVTLFSATVEISCTKKFAGSGADPTLAEMFDVTPSGTSADWDHYWAAFA